jgi:hypothetical protein
VLHRPDVILNKARREEELKLSGIRATPFERGPYYGNYVQQKCNHPDSRATPFGRGLNMKTRGACYRKPVAQKTFRTLSATVQMLPREICFRLVLGLLSL